MQFRTVCFICFFYSAGRVKFHRALQFSSTIASSDLAAVKKLRSLTELPIQYMRLRDMELLNLIKTNERQQRGVDILRMLLDIWICYTWLKYGEKSIQSLKITPFTLTDIKCILELTCCISETLFISLKNAETLLGSADHSALLT